MLLILEEREKLKHQDFEWVIDEACNSASLQCDGTFHHVLSRKLDGVMIPIFANILTFADCYNNLEMICAAKYIQYSHACIFNHIMYCYSIFFSNVSQLKKQLWVKIFNNEDLYKFFFHNQSTDTAEFNKLHEVLKQDFTCQFPFFWVIKDIIDSEFGKLSYSKYMCGCSVLI